MDAESVLRDLIEQRRREFQRVPLESRDNFALGTVTPWLQGACHALVAMGLISQERAEEILLQGWYDLLHEAGLMEYGDEGTSMGFSAEFSKGEAEPGEPSPEQDGMK
jgi:hypothetical protein